MSPMFDSPMMDSIGEVFEENYKIQLPVRVLGEGGFATVKACERIKDGERCAVKHVLYPFEDVTEYAVNARTEYNILMNLSGH
jgi:serine/threonine protein kinase